jgi:hypothetical protein
MGTAPDSLRKEPAAVRAKGLHHSKAHHTLAIMQLCTRRAGAHVHTRVCTTHPCARVHTRVQPTEPPHCSPATSWGGSAPAVHAHAAVAPTGSPASQFIQLGRPTRVLPIQEVPAPAQATCGRPCGDSALHTAHAPQSPNPTPPAAETRQAMVAQSCCPCTGDPPHRHTPFDTHMLHAPGCRAGHTCDRTTRV